MNASVLSHACDEKIYPTKVAANITEGKLMIKKHIIFSHVLRKIFETRKISADITNAKIKDQQRSSGLASHVTSIPLMTAAHIGIAKNAANVLKKAKYFLFERKKYPPKEKRMAAIPNSA